MTTTFQTVDSIGTGVRFTFAADDDGYAVLQGVTVASTNSIAILSDFTDSIMQIDGTVLADNIAIRMNGDRAAVTIGVTGIVGTLDSLTTNTAVFLDSVDGSLTNFGHIAGNSTAGVLTGENNASVENFGVISGSSGVFLGLFGDTGNTLVNGGTVASSAYDDVLQSYRYNNGVMSEGANTTVTNLSQGVISAVSVAGAGVRFDEGNGSGNKAIGGSIVVNFGEISSLQYYGVYFNGAAGDTVKLNNWGTISGGSGAFMGNEEVNIVHNGGLMLGDVLLGAGADTFKMKSTGSVNGSIFGEDGNDTIYGGNADDTVFGGLNVDLLAGKAGDDSLDGGGGGDELRGGRDDDDLYGGAGNDTLFGGAGDDTLDGGFNNDTLDGGKGDDALLGGKGNDVLDGGAGNDTLTGGNNLDTFVFGLKAGNDTITDFQDGNDDIDLTAYNLSGRGDLVAAGAMTDTALGAVIDLSLLGGIGTVTITGMLVADLNNSEFLF
ncbi:MAG: calcium-binding protein [Hyphomicrobiales bacterium]|nr:calcium-binding protein [Hyphomicrobiales bacterium]